MKKDYAAIDFGRLAFALLIPFLHIDFDESNVFIAFLQQYISRLGVPYFFCVSGMFLRSRIESVCPKDAFKSYIHRTAVMFCCWLAVYLPILLNENGQLSIGFVQQVLFRTPAYLWFLGALMLASIPFCFIKRTKLFYLGVGGAYLLGTLISGSYQWLTGGISVYNHMFLTSRNALFFALPMMIVGELVYVFRETKIRFERTILPCLFLALVCEIFIVRNHVSNTSDTSMYILFPPFFFFFTRFLMRIPLKMNNTRSIRKLSSALYVGQYGGICIAGAILNGAGIALTSNMKGWFTYLCVLLIALLLFLLSKKIKLMRNVI